MYPQPGILHVEPSALANACIAAGVEAGRHGRLPGGALLGQGQPWRHPRAKFVGADNVKPCEALFTVQMVVVVLATTNGSLAELCHNMHHSTVSCFCWPCSICIGQNRTSSIQHNECSVEQLCCVQCRQCCALCQLQTGKFTGCITMCVTPLCPVSVGL